MLQNLHLQSHRPIPFAVANLLPSIQDIITQHLQEEVIPVIEDFRLMCAHNNDLVTREIYKKLQPALDMTADMCRHAQLEVASAKHF
jgi:hypothetical protein